MTGKSGGPGLTTYVDTGICSCDRRPFRNSTNDIRRGTHAQLLETAGGQGYPGEMVPEDFTF
jgi:hypothetical protein